MTNKKAAWEPQGLKQNYASILAQNLFSQGVFWLNAQVKKADIVFQVALLAIRIQPDRVPIFYAYLLKAIEIIDFRGVA